MPKVLFVATVVKTHIMEFHIPYLKMFHDEGWETAVAARNDYENPAECVIPYCDHYYNISFERNPIKRENIKAYKDLKTIIDEGKYDIIHCHTPVGAMITRLTARKARKIGTKVFYTAHGFHFYKGAPLVNWLIYYPVEKFLSRYTDVLITINKEDYERAKGFHAKKVVYIPGVGIDVKKFEPNLTSNSEKIRQEEQVRKVLGIPVDAIILLSVGEVNRNKNHSVVIKAMANLQDNNIYYVICGSGPLIDEDKQLAKKYKLSNKVIFAGYRKDVDRFYRLADIFIFPSFREGLPVSVMEAMASGLPIICSKIRGNIDLVQNGVNGYLVAPSSQEEIASAITKLKDKKVRDKIRDNNLRKAKKVDLNNILQEYYRIYF